LLCCPEANKYNLSATSAVTSTSAIPQTNETIISPSVNDALHIGPTVGDKPHLMTRSLKNLNAPTPAAAITLLPGLETKKKVREERLKDQRRKEKKGGGGANGTAGRTKRMGSWERELTIIYAY
jgi:hypothetical protein